MSINKQTVDNAIFECERFLERARLVASLGYWAAGVRHTAALKRSCAEVRNAVVAVKKEVGAEEFDKNFLKDMQEYWEKRSKGDTDE